MRHSLLLLAIAVVPFANAAQSSQDQKTDAQSGQQTFAICAGCHGLDGAGGEHAPNIATEARVQQLSDAALISIVHNGIPAAGMPSFGKNLSSQQIRAVVDYLRVLQGKRKNASLPGDPKRGQEVFFGRGACAECHLMKGRGGFLGADLSGYGATHSPETLREAIVAPNRNLDWRKAAVTVVAQNGMTLRGVLRNEDNFSLQMQTPDGAFHFFDKRSLRRLDREAVSLMPADYGTKLSAGELDDLISFLSEAAAAPPAKEQEENE